MTSTVRTPLTPRLGQKVKDVTSGLVGIATVHQLTTSGNERLGIQPEGDGKTMPDILLVDIQSIDVVDDGIANRVTKPPQVSIRLGEEVQDVVTGFKGIATARMTYINGCVYFNVTAKLPKGQLTGDVARNVSHAELKAIGKGIADTLEVNKPSEEPRKGTGGPSIRFMRPVR